MSNQPYEGYEGYDPYAGQQQYPEGPYRDQQHQQQYQQQSYEDQQQQYQQPYPDAQQPYAQQPYADQQPYAQPYPDQQQYADQQYADQQHYPQAYAQDQYSQDQYTQQWEGQTWETQARPLAAVDVTETAYLPAQGDTYNPPSPPREERPATSEAAGAEAAPESEGSGAGPTYGRATTTGNARVTDAQRARAEGRSPVIEPGMQPAALTAVLGLLLAAGAAVGQYALLVPLVILQAVTAAGWFRLNGMWPARQGIALAFLGGVVADAVLLGVGKENAPAAILGTLGVWVLLVLVLQLRSRAGADERMYGLMATVVSAALAIIAAGHLAAVSDAVTVGGIAVAVAILARALPLPTPVSVVVALLAAAGAGVAVGGMNDLGSKGALLAVGAGVCALIGHRVASYDYPSRFVHMTAGVALPLAAAAPVVYVLGRAIG
ncbi:hypothetical protein GKQ77_23810 [Streptomyces sp. BG9H]|uniref:Integral membrane protein n=1 Tax=Streptomyces anatolicus TaxID=2675858 RepID=A0ABS6YSY6_9ACTN|nr:hypothetical protein [Streptomyces anatolicus]MBW5424553.1 hypothetical protein [Streptomyces anatolicus]